MSAQTTDETNATEKTKRRYEIFQYFFCKKKNKRIDITVWKNASNGEFASVVVEIKRLEGDWRKRHIIKVDMNLGIESFFILTDIFHLLNCDPAFLKLVNPQMGVFHKDRMKCATNVQSCMPK